MSARAPTRDSPSSPRGERRRQVIRLRPVLVIACIAAATWFVYDAPPADDTIEFRFTGVPESYVVPAGICRVRIEAVGAARGAEGTTGAPGSGARGIARVGVTPGELLAIRVGGLGGTALGTSPVNGGWNGGSAGAGAAGHQGKAGSGGGGATDVRIGGDRVEHRVVVAGGGSGGAGGGIGGPSGTGDEAGGAPIGGEALATLGTANLATGGGGGMQVAGGSRGGNAPDLSIAATGGSLGIGVSGAAGGVSGGGAGGGFGWATITYDRENDACRTTPRKGDPAASADRERGYATLQTGGMPDQWNSGIRDHTAEAAHPVPAKPSPAAVTAFYRRAAERTARLMGKPAPKWKLCPSCKLAFHGPDTVPENSATGHTPGDWQP